MIPYEVGCSPCQVDRRCGGSGGVGAVAHGLNQYKRAEVIMEFFDCDETRNQISAASGRQTCKSVVHGASSSR